jgi:hypothetical protein
MIGQLVLSRDGKSVSSETYTEPIIAVNQLNSRAGFEPRRQLKFGKGDARPLWKPHLIVPASRGGVYLESTRSVGRVKISVTAMNSNSQILFGQQPPVPLAKGRN